MTAIVPGDELVSPSPGTMLTNLGHTGTHQNLTFADSLLPSGGSHAWSSVHRSGTIATPAGGGTVVEQGAKIPELNSGIAIDKMAGALESDHHR